MITNKWTATALTSLALTCASALIQSVSADTTNLIARTTFDADGPAGWAYGYYYGDNGLGVYQGPDRAYFEPTDVNQTNAVCRFTFDNSALTGNSNYGTGFGGPQFMPNIDPAIFVSSDRADYIFSFDARAEGLLPNHATASGCEMQVQFMNTAQTPNKILQVNLPFSPGSTWTHYSFGLADDNASVSGDTSDKMFEQGYTGITGLQFNVNAHLPDGSWGFDSDNAILVDNMVLQVIARPPATNPPPPTVNATIANWNFDDNTIGYSYEYSWTEHGEKPVMSASYTNAVGVGGSKAWILHMDNSALASDVPSWAGGGTGGEGPADYSGFKVNDLACYQVSFDARVEGLAADATSTTCALQLFLRAPDDTVPPADADTDNDLIVQLNFGLSGLTADWQNMSFKLSKGAVGGGSKTNFMTYYSKISQIQTQWQIENAASAADWDFDSNNALVIDNFKLERIDTGCPPLTVTLSGTDVVATWSQPATGTTKLQSSATVNGTYSDVAGATSPYKTPATGAPKFFRTVWVPPAQ